MTRELLVFKSKRLQIYGVAFLIAFLFLSNQKALSQDNDSVMADEPSLSPEISFEGEYEKSNENWYSPMNELGITGSLRGGYWSSNRLNNNENNLITSSTWLTLDKRLRQGLTLYADGYIYNQDTFGSESSDHRVKEIYVHFRSGDWDYRLGRQIVAWGRADRLNPTDNLTPRDFTLLSPEIDEERM